ncbi:hypothetical protein Cba03nite_17530 [Catellatospora bangladeshensis]|uniref:Transposase putative helix-turn-helix domain-containing protein n=1 Tax=Catellatospora bangladeshensis TaxID=310355 RepID=A0A8J3JM08_9ACTN|nr:hypothetical protein Cba03nite_17530 [Catellatospora bangladeshensis]
MVVQAYRFALDPTPAQDRDLHRHAGAGRFAFNWALAAVRANLDQRAAERTYGLDGEQLTPALGWSLPALRRAWNTAKPQVVPWWGQCSKEAFNTGLDGLARALGNWSASRSGRRAGARVGFPRFRSRRRVTPSVRFTTGTIRVEDTRHHVTLPRLGRIRTHESTRKLARRLHAGTARIMSATVRHTGGRWHVSFTVQITRTVCTPAYSQQTVGVDVGIANLAVLSTGQIVPNPAIWPPLPGGCAPQPGPCPDGKDQTGAPAGSRPGAGSRPKPAWPAHTPGSRTCAPTACTNSPRPWPAPTARSWSRTSTSPG